MYKKWHFILVLLIIHPIHSQYDLEFRPFKESQHLSKNFLQTMQKLFNISTFVETGTCMGETTRVAAEVFETVYTIELSEELHRDVQERLSLFDNITFFLGDSADTLSKVMKNIEEPVMFFLDAHFSGSNTVRQGCENCPTIRELKAIKKSGNNTSVIIVDDLRFFQEEIILDAQTNDTPDDESLYGYPRLVDLVLNIRKINPEYYFIVYGDALIAYPSWYGLNISPLLKAMTVSRFTQDSLLSIHYSEKVIKNAEQIIAQAKNEESHALQYLILSNVTHQVALSYLYWFWYSLNLKKRSEMPSRRERVLYSS